MNIRTALCFLGFHLPPDPNTPPDMRYYRCRSFDCGYPPYSWECRACHEFYGRYSDHPKWQQENVRIPRVCLHGVSLDHWCRYCPSDERTPIVKTAPVKS